MTKSMVEGNAFKQILLFMLPLALGSIFQQAYNLADAAIVGQSLGADALAAVGVSSSVQFLVLGFCTGSAQGFAIPIATAFGAKRENEIKQLFYIGFILLFMIACVVTISCALLTNQILLLLKAPADIMSNSYWYLFIIFIGIPFTLLYNYLAAVLRSVGDSKTPFLFLAFSSVLNIGLDFFCILSLHWGVPGAAIATVFSQAVSSILCLLLIHKKFPLLHVTAEAKVWDKEKALHMANMGIPMGLQFSITAIGCMMMQASNNALGSNYVSALAAGQKINNFAMCPFEALGASVSTFISQNLGAGKKDRIYEGLKVGTISALIYSVVAGFILVFLGYNLGMIFVSSSEVNVLSYTAMYLKFVGINYALLGLLYIFRMATQGVGESRLAIQAGVLEMIARTGASLFLVTRLGYTGICIEDPLAWIFADIYIIPICFYALKRSFVRYGIQ